MDELLTMNKYVVVIKQGAQLHTKQGVSSFSSSIFIAYIE